MLTWCCLLPTVLDCFLHILHYLPLLFPNVTVSALCKGHASFATSLITCITPFKSFGFGNRFSHPAPVVFVYSLNVSIFCALFSLIACISACSATLSNHVSHVAYISSGHSAVIQPPTTSATFSATFQLLFFESAIPLFSWSSCRIWISLIHASPTFSFLIHCL